MNTIFDFVRADSSNLPKVDTIMLLEFMKSSDKHNVAEIRGAKALISSRQSYVESAVGYVEVKRAGSLCDVRAKIVPEHKINSKYYTVTIHLDDAEDAIIETSCDGCAAVAGGCKHTLVLLYWLQKRSAEPSPTSVECYWVKHARRFDDFQPPEQADFRKGFSTVDHIHTLRQVTQKTEEYNLPLHLARITDGR